MRRLVNYSIILLIVSLSSCSDIFEQSLEDENVVILSPKDNDTTSLYTNLFWWNTVDYASKYKLQIVSPSFNSINKLLLDTTIETTKLNFTLAPGSYQWRVRAENGSSSSAFVTQAIVVDTASLAVQTLQIISPLSGYSSKSKNVTFSWQPLFGAENYQIQIDTFDGTFSSGIIVEQLIPEPQETFSYSFKSDGRYKWRAKAINSTASTPYTKIFNFFIDGSKPLPPAKLNVPTSFNRPIQLSWDPSSSADVVRYRLYLYVQTATATTQIGSPIDISSGTSYSFNLGSVGDNIVWKVTAIDQAGNESDFSTSQNFTISS